MKLVPITKDEVRLAKGADRIEALNRYYAWLNKSREEDKQILNKQQRRIRYFKAKKEGKLQKYNPEWNRRWREKNKEKLKAQRREAYLKRKNDPVLNARDAECDRQYYLRNREKLLAKAREYYATVRKKRKDTERQAGQ